MAKLYIFGIGGTGSRVLRSFTMLMASGVQLGSDIDEVVPIIIDPDKSNADLTRTVMLMNNYREVRSNLKFTEDNPSQFFRHEILKTLGNYTLHIDDTDDKTFEQFIELSSMDKTYQAMIRMLFSSKNLGSSMDVGFKGNPNIGSVVLNQIVRAKGFVDFANSFESGDKIFIVSSIFGGTGASGFPLLLKTLRINDTMDNHELINHAAIGAVTIMPYFKLESDGDSEINSSTFISKTKSALAYYENSIVKNDSINAFYYLADDMSNTYENHQGGDMQRNDAHLVEFLAATAIVDFTNNVLSDSTTNKEFGIKEISDAVTFNSFCAKDKRILFEPLTQFVLLSNCLTDKYDYFSSSDFNANSGYFKGLYTTSFMKELIGFCSEYKDWLTEMKGNKRSLDLFNLNCKRKPFDVVTDVKPQRVWSFKSDYFLVADRLNAKVKKCQAKEKKDRFLEMYYLATQQLVNEKFGKA